MRQNVHWLISQNFAQRTAINADPGSIILGNEFHFRVREDRRLDVLGLGQFGEDAFHDLKLVGRDVNCRYARRGLQWISRISHDNRVAMPKQGQFLLEFFLSSLGGGWDGGHKRQQQQTSSGDFNFHEFATANGY